MARKHYWQFLVTDEGNPIENAQISIYVAGTEDPVYVYNDEVGGTVTNLAPQTVTSRKGFFEFWIADQNEPNGYTLDTKFKIAWSATGVSTGYIDYVDVFSTAWEEVDVTDSNQTRNKAVSNFLAKGWQDHIESELPLVSVHGLDMVNELSTDGNRSKLVSDYMAYMWDYHTKRQWNGTDASVVNPNQAPDVHGILSVDETDTNTDKNRLVSNFLAKGWEDHVANVIADPHPQYMSLNGSDTFIGATGYENGILLTVTGISTETDHTPGTYTNVPLGSGFPHPAYATVTVGVGGDITDITVTDGGLGYRAPQEITILASDIGGGTDATCHVETVDDTVPESILRGNDFITQSMLRDTEAAAIVQPIGTGNDGSMGADGVYYYDLTDNGDGTYSVVFDHNIQTTYPMVTVWKNIGVSQGEVVQPISIISNSSNTITVTFSEEATFVVRIHGRVLV